MTNLMITEAQKEQMMKNYLFNTCNINSYDQNTPIELKFSFNDNTKYEMSYMYWIDNLDPNENYKDSLSIVKVV